MSRFKIGELFTFPNIVNPSLFVTGNHENYWMLRELPVEDWHSGKVQRVRPNILRLMRGHLYEIEGRTLPAGCAHGFSGVGQQPADYSALFTALDALMTANLPQMELYCDIGRIVIGRIEVRPSVDVKVPGVRPGDKNELYSISE